MDKGHMVEGFEKEWEIGSRKVREENDDRDEGEVLKNRDMRGGEGEKQRAASGNEWDERGIDSQVSEKELTRGQKEGSRRWRERH